MSAGIISACLPTLGPVVLFAGRKMGIKGLLHSRSGLASGNAVSSKNMPRSAAGSASDRTEVELQKPTKKDGAGTFYRLPDDQASSRETTAPSPVDGRLRPQHGYGYSVTSRPGNVGDGGSSSGDEAPLHGIRVHTDFMQSAS